VRILHHRYGLRLEKEKNESSTNYTYEKGDDAKMLEHIC
jgi:hypothetical protein